MQETPVAANSARQDQGTHPFTPCRPLLQIKRRSEAQNFISPARDVVLLVEMGDLHALFGCPYGTRTSRVERVNSHNRNLEACDLGFNKDFMY